MLARATALELGMRVYNALWYENLLAYNRRLLEVTERARRARKIASERDSLLPESARINRLPGSAFPESYC